MPNICVVGDVMLDRYIYGSADRVSPEAPVIVHKYDDEKCNLGGAANVAQILQVNGYHPSLFGVVGRDSAADIVKSLADDIGMFFSFVQCHKPTIQKMRFVAEGKQVFRHDVEQMFPVESSTELLETLQSGLSSYSDLIISDYGKGSCSDVSGLIETANRFGVRTYIDPSNRDFASYTGCTVIKANRLELYRQIKVFNSDFFSPNVFEIDYASLIKIWGCKVLVVTLGDQGALAFSDESGLIVEPAQKVAIADVTGAGDTFVASFSVSFAQGHMLSDCLRLAVKSSSESVKSFGNASSFIYRGHLESANELQELQSYVRHLKSTGKTIGFTNGCFDLFHIGHLDYLRKASLVCDYLIVGLNSDASVRRLKGDGRPINDFNTRKMFLEALPFIDAVVGFSDETPIDLISLIMPDYLFKGGDYEISSIVGSDIVLANGGETIVFPFVANHSSSLLIDRIRASFNEV